MQPELREPTEQKRETQPNAADASPSAQAWRERMRNLSIAAAAGGFMAVVGAMNTGGLTMTQRLLYWVPMMIGGALVADVIVRFVNRIPRAGASPWIFGAILAAAITMPIALGVWAYTAWVFQRPLDPNELPYLIGPVFFISAAMTAVMLMVNTPGRVTHAPEAGAAPAPVRFLERLPPKLRGAVIYAVSAEDHYLRLHTSKGADLILMRLTDAVGELEGLEGAQTHRSWWVARDAVEGSRRDGDRMTLLLKGGVEAPVSRPNVRPLREAGWF